MEKTVINTSEQTNTFTNALRLLVLVGAVAIGLPLDASAKGKPLQSAPISAVFDAVNAWDGSENGLLFDSEAYVIDGVDGTDAIVGSSFNIIVDLLRSSRGVVVDLSAPVTDSVDVTIPITDGDGTPIVACGDNDFGDSYWQDLINGGSSFLDAKFLVLGHDYLKLEIGSLSHVNAELEFYDIDGNRWQLRWGPYEKANSGYTYNPGSDPVMVIREDADTWTFTTTSDHHAALYRYGNASQSQSQKYYGQFRIPFSGTAVALESQTVPDSTISAILVNLVPPDVQITEPAGDLTLPVDSIVTFEATVLNLCSPIVWTVNGEVVATGSSFEAQFIEEGGYIVEASAENMGVWGSDSVGITIGDTQTTDNDGDGWTVAEGDCDDNDSKVHPGANDTRGKQGRDGIDNDCDGVIDG
jgi:hypothetical protein